MKTIITLFAFLTIFSRNTVAQDITILERHEGTVWSVAFSPDGKTLASGSGDDTIRLWDVQTGVEKQRFTGHTGNVSSVAFSPDGKTLASGGGWDNTIRLWDVETGTELRTLTGPEHTRGVNSVAFSPDGKTLASGRTWNWTYDNTIRLLDVTTGETIRTFRIGYPGNVNSVAFSPDGKTLASSSNDTIRLWDVETGIKLRTLTEHEDTVSSVAFSPDGKTLASGSGSFIRYSDDTIRLWDVETGTELRTLTGHTRGVSSVAFSPDGKILASGSSDNTIRLWDVETWTHLHTLTEHEDTVWSVAFSPDGKILASGGSDKTIRLWRMPSTHINIAPELMVSPAVGEQFTIGVSIVAGENVGGYQISLEFDTTALRYIESSNGDYLPPGAFFVPPVISGNRVTLGSTSLAGVSNGDGTLATITFEVVNVKESTLSLSDVICTDSEGEQLLILKSDSKIVLPEPVSSSAVISITPSEVSAAIGGKFTLSIDVTGGENVEKYVMSLGYNQTELQYVSFENGNYLDQASLQKRVGVNAVTLQATSFSGVGNGDGTLATVTFEVLESEPTETLTVNTSNVAIVNVYFRGGDGLEYIPTLKNAQVVVQITAPLFGDVNSDGVVNILDLVQVASKFGQTVSGDPADVNEDGVVNIVDLVKVAGALGGGAAAPSALYSDLEAMPTRATVQKWLSQAQQLNLTDATSQRGILFLEQLLASLTPKETALLPNYPNPFNPETWIPYQLAKPADVTVTIYTVDGTVVRTLALGHQPIGIYQDKSRAAYWDGKNEVGESVASDVYFYTLTAGDFTATRKMLIRK